MNIAILFPLLAIVAGAMTAFQPLINAKLNGQVASPLWAAFISFAVGTVLLFVLAYLQSGKLVGLNMEGVKWWMWTGGILGAFFVTVALVTVPHLGVATMIALTIAGQLIMASILSHYGVLADMPRPITLQKAAGLLLVAVGAYITLKAKS